MNRELERGYARTGLGQVHYYASGDGKPIILLHQAGRSARMFADLIPLLAPQFRVVAIDLPGFGASDPLPSGTSIEDLAECVADAAETMGLGGFDLYGLHTGNKIAAALALSRPETVGRLILAGQSHSLIPDNARRNAAIGPLAAADMRMPEEDDVAGQAASWLARARKVATALLDPALGSTGFSQDARGHAVDIALDAMTADGTAVLYGANLAYDLGSAMARLRLPTLILEVVNDEEDHRLGRQAEAVQALIPGSRLATIAEPDGLSTLENRAADVATIVLAFLAEGRDDLARTR